MDQKKINKYLRWFEKGIRIFAGGVLLAEIGLMFFSGFIIYHNYPGLLVPVTAWQLFVAIGSITLKSFICSYLVFGKWSLVYVPKTNVTDSSLVGDRSW